MAPGHAGDAMALGETMMVAGVGCRRGTSAAEIKAVIEAALARAGLASRSLDVIATPSHKSDEAGIAAAASALGVRLVLVPQAERQRGAFSALYQTG